MLQLLLLTLAGVCAAEPAEFQTIKGRVKLPKTARPPTMRVVLNDGAAGEDHATFTRVDGSFEIDNILPGVYTLQVVSIPRRRACRMCLPIACRAQCAARVLRAATSGRFGLYFKEPHDAHDVILGGDDVYHAQNDGEYGPGGVKENAGGPGEDEAADGGWR